MSAVGIEVRSSGPGPRPVWGWSYPDTHAALRDGRVVRYWILAAQHDDRRSGVAIIIRRAA